MSSLCEFESKFEPSRQEQVGETVTTESEFPWCCGYTSVCATFGVLQAPLLCSSIWFFLH